MWWPQTNSLFLFFPTDCSLVLFSACVLVTIDSIRWYLQPNQVSQVVQLQDGTSIHAVARRFDLSPSLSQEHGGENKADRLLHKESWTQP